MKKTLRLQGLDCAACAAELEELISKIEGVSEASVSFVNQRVVLEYTDESVLEKVTHTINTFEEVRVVETSNGEKNDKWEWISIAISAVFLALGVISGRFFPTVAYICYGIAYLVVGLPVLIATAKNIAHGRIFDENFLMTVASIGAVFLGEYIESVAVMLLYCLGESLQALAVRSSRGSLTALLSLKSDKTDALRMENGKIEYRSLAPEEIIIGDKLIVKTGERVPVDGVLLSNSAEMDTKALTGEADLRHVEKGGEVLSGFVNAGAVFQMQATRVYEDSAVGRILDMVQNASSGKAKPEKFITKFARVYTPVVCLLALLVAVIAPFFNGVAIGEGFRFVNGARWLRSALTFLVVSCPCALIISVPLTYFSGIGACAKRGILVKGATYLDTLAKTNIVAFDKTGTLTEGNFTICGVYPQGIESETLVLLTSAVERYSAHPIAKAFPKTDTAFSVSDIQELSGRGLTVRLDGQRLLVGNAKLLEEYGVKFTPIASAYTLVYVAKGGVYLGAIEIGDKTREEAKAVLERLKKQGVRRTVMLTGDNKSRALRVAEEVSIDEVYADLLPDDKLVKAQELQKQGLLVYIGDGINDAPVMVVADCAVSMGKLGSAVAVEASDLVLIFDDLTAIPSVICTAKKTRKIVFQNIVFSIVMKTAFMVLGAIGILPLSLAVFADVGVMLLAVVNSFRVKK